MQHDATTRGAEAEPARGPRPLSRQQHLLLAGLFVPAVALRIAYWWGHVENNPLFGDPQMDEGKHHEWAVSILSGQGLGDTPFFRAPLYYYALAGFYALFGVNPIAARLAGCLMGSVSCYLIARLGATLGGLGVGLVAGLIAAVYWPLVHFDAHLFTVGVEIFLNLLMLWWLLEAVQRRSWWLLVLAGAAWGLSAVARPNVLALAPGIGAWVWAVWNHRTNGRPRWRLHAARLRAPALVGAAAAIMIMPVAFRNYAVSGELVLVATNGGVNFYIGNNPFSDGITAIVPGTRPTWEGGYEDTHRLVEEAIGRQPTESEVSRYWSRKAWAWIRSDPGAWAALTLHKVRLFFSPVELYNNFPIQFFAEMSGASTLFVIGFPLIACLGIAGLVMIVRERRAWRLWSLPIMFGVLYAVTVVAFFVPGRFRLPVVPVLILLAAQGIVRLPECWQARRWRLLGAYAGLAGLCAVFVWTNPPRPVASYYHQGAGLGHHLLGIYYEEASTEQPELREAAAAHFMEGMRLRPDDTPMAATVVPALLRLGYGGYAEQVAAALAARRPDDAEPVQIYSQVLVVLGRAEEAVDLMEQARRRRPDDPRILDGLAWALASADRNDEAAAVAREALEIARRAGEAGLARAIESRLEIYSQQQEEPSPPPRPRS